MSRVLKISAALAILGAIAGAIGGCLVLAIGVIVFGYANDIWEGAAIGAALGAACGVLVAPMLSWTLLRDVPIWRSATETAFITSFAGIAALTFTSGRLPEILAVAALAAALAVARLKWAFRRRRAPKQDIAA